MNTVGTEQERELRRQARAYRQAIKRCRGICDFDHVAHYERLLRMVNAELKHLRRAHRTPEYAALSDQGRAYGENRDCAVVALAAACGVSYTTARDTLTRMGRQPGEGTWNPLIYRAVRALGCKLRTVHPHEITQHYPGRAQYRDRVTTLHPRKFNDAWKNGRSYLLFVRRHVAAVVNGECHDWSAGRSLRVQTIYEVAR